MKYNRVIKGTFIERLNRFTATVTINGNIETVHIKNTGRCKELFLRGATVYLSQSSNKDRKTKYDLIAVKKDNENKVVNVDSQIPNALVEDWIKRSKIFSENAKIKREVFYRNSRFDLYVEDGNRKTFIEVKGVTLENDATALFPDAPTERGVKHLKELMSALSEGYGAYVIFVIQMKGVNKFTPNRKTHIEFAETLKTAHEKGVKVIALDCIVTPNTIDIDKQVQVEL